LYLVGRGAGLIFVIAVYDVGQKRVGKVLKTCRKYLYWVQNSVLEGEINESSFRKLKIELANVIDEEYDSVIFYTFRTTKYSKREIMGVEKGGEDNFL
jgi:CRISPR-associated protein Cas2